MADPSSIKNSQSLAFGLEPFFPLTIAAMRLGLGLSASDSLSRTIAAPTVKPKRGFAAISFNAKSLA